MSALPGEQTRVVCVSRNCIHGELSAPAPLHHARVMARVLSATSETGSHRGDDC